MGLIPFDQLYNAGANAADFGKAVASAVGNAVCSVYKSNPAGIVPSFGDPLGVGSFNKGLWDTLCAPSEPGLPENAIASSGGQCPVDYTVTVNYTYVGPPGIPEPVTGQATFFFVRGPMRLRVESFGQNQIRLDLIGSTATGGEDVRGVLSFGAVGNSPRVYNYSFSSVRQDGNPDNCGTINYYNDYSEVTNPPPVVVTPPGGAPSFTLPVVFIRPTATVNAPISVRVGSIPVNIDLGGVSIDFGGSGSGSGGLTPAQEATLNQTLNNTTITNNQLDNVQDSVEEVYQDMLKLSPETFLKPTCDSGQGACQPFSSFTIVGKDGNSIALWQKQVSEELCRLRTKGLLDCASSRVPSVIMEEDIDEEGYVRFSPVQAQKSIGYLLEITGMEPQTLRTYKLAGVNSEFGAGNAAICNEDGAVRGNFIRVFQSSTFLDTRAVPPPFRVRLSLKKGISYRLTDLGYLNF